MPSIKFFKTPFLRLWGIPVILGLITCIGLISALLGDGFWDVLSSILLGLLVVTMLYCLKRERN